MRVSKPEARIIARIDAERIPRHIGKAAAGEVELDVIGLLLGALLVQQTARQEGGFRRVFPCTSGRDRHRRRGSCAGRWRCCSCGRLGGRRLVQLLEELLEHPRRLLAAGGAEVEAGLALVGDGVGIVGAIVAALAAILLRHGRHHAAAERPALREVHTVGDPHRRIVPGRLAVVAVATRCKHRGILGRRERGRAVEAQHADEKSVQPQPLAVAEGRVGRNDLEFRWDGHLGHAVTSTSASLRKASPSWRREKVRKVSSGEARLAR